MDSGCRALMAPHHTRRTTEESLMTRPTLVHLGAMLVMLSSGGSLNAQVVVITSVKNPVSSIKRDLLAQIFLGQAHVFPNGAKAEPLDLPQGSQLREAFYQQFLEKRPAQLKSHWSGQTFSGRKQPPRMLNTSKDILKLVAKHPKYIAYVDQSAVDPTVKVLRIE